MLYFTSLWLFRIYELVLLDLFISFTQLPFSLLATISLFSVSMSLLLFYLFVYFVLLIAHVCEIIWYLSFSVWFISLSIIPSRSIHVVANGKTSFLWLSNIPLNMYHHFLIHSSTDGHLGHFHNLATVNNAAMNIGVHMFFWIIVFYLI